MLDISIDDSITTAVLTPEVYKQYRACLCLDEFNPNATIVIYKRLNIAVHMKCRALLATIYITLHPNITNRELQRVFMVSPRTVRTYRVRIYRNDA